MKYASNNIPQYLDRGPCRPAGKTTLTEALVIFRALPSVWAGSRTAPRFRTLTPRKQSARPAWSASVVPVEYEGIKYNLIDAPGLFDFEAGEYEGIRAAESVLVVVSGRSGVTVGAEKAFQLARKNGKATMVFVSKCDLENANYFKILEDMKIKFGSTVLPLRGARQAGRRHPRLPSTCSARRPSSTRAASRSRWTCRTSATVFRA